MTLTLDPENYPKLQREKDSGAGLIRISEEVKYLIPFEESSGILIRI